MSKAARALCLGVSAISLALVAAGLSACMAVLESTAPSPTNVERLEIGTPRSTVESVLGSPESQKYNRSTYEFSREQHHRVEVEGILRHRSVPSPSARSRHG
jgi:outer membrane protein assembly factor BamE (lipoprotein component of BamABCDE complex)